MEGGRVTTQEGEREALALVTVIRIEICFLKMYTHTHTPTYTYTHTHIRTHEKLADTQRAGSTERFLTSRTLKTQNYFLCLAFAIDFLPNNSKGFGVLQVTLRRSSRLNFQHVRYGLQCLYVFFLFLIFIFPHFSLSVWRCVSEKKNSKTKNENEKKTHVFEKYRRFVFSTLIFSCALSKSSGLEKRGRGGVWEEWEAGRGKAGGAVVGAGERREEEEVAVVVWEGGRVGEVGEGRGWEVGRRREEREEVGGDEERGICLAPEPLLLIRISVALPCCDE